MKFSAPFIILLTLAHGQEYELQSAFSGPSFFDGFVSGNSTSSSQESCDISDDHVELLYVMGSDVGLRTLRRSSSCRAVQHDQHHRLLGVFWCRHHSNSGSTSESWSAQHTAGDRPKLDTWVREETSPNIEEPNWCQSVCS